MSNEKIILAFLNKRAGHTATRKIQSLIRRLAKEKNIEIVEYEEA